MINLIGKRKIWYAISLIMIVPGIISLFLYGLNLGIDFRSGEMVTVAGTPKSEQLSKLASEAGFKDVQIVTAGNQTQIRFSDPAPQAERESNHEKFKAKLASQGIEELSFDSVGPTVSKDIARNAIVSLILVSIAIVAYIAFAFRNAPPPVSSLSFGVIAIVALLHDSLFLLGVFSILGHFWGVEIDALFVTALLTVIGFSVHDTIVVFDRIRENLRREKGTFEQIVNMSVVETMGRSINTSFTVVFTLLALLLFGGQSIHYFVLALLIGIISGTYSSIFTASPLLVTWHNFKLKRHAKSLAKPKTAKA